MILSIFLEEFQHSPPLPKTFSPSNTNELLYSIKRALTLPRSPFTPPINQQPPKTFSPIPTDFNLSERAPNFTNPSPAAF